MPQDPGEEIRTTAPNGTAHMRRASSRVAGVVAAGVLLLGACGGDDEDDATGDDEPAGAEEGAPAAPEEAMTVGFASPGDGESVDAAGFEVAFDSSVPIGEPSSGDHHVHLFYDGDTSTGAYDMVFADTFTVDRLEEGEHTVEAVLANPDHTLTDTRAEITVQVGGAGGAPDSGSDSPAPTEDEPGYGY